MFIKLPDSVELPWYLRPVEQRTTRELCYVGNPWEDPIWFGTWNGWPFACPFDGAILQIEMYADYSHGHPPEPVHTGYCPICGTECEL